MKEKPDWRIKYEAELAHGKRAREAGNEGMARVCARRAAALAVREFYSRRKKVSGYKSGIAALRSVATDPDVSEELRGLAAHFSMVINFDHELPAGVDLLAEAETLAEALLDIPRK